MKHMPLQQDFENHPTERNNNPAQHIQILRQPTAASNMHNSCTNAASNVAQHLHNKNTPYRDKLADAYRDIKREYKTLAVKSSWSAT